MKIEETTALVSITSFAVQQALQVVDPLVGLGVLGLQCLPCLSKVTSGEIKKPIMSALSFVFGLVIAASVTKLRLLSMLEVEGVPTWLDVVVTGLALGAGTEGTNSIVKYLGYVKEARKAATVEIGILPSSVTTAPGGTVNFKAQVANVDNREVTWTVFQSDAGTIDSNGKYTAGHAGTFQVAAISAADPSKIAIATVKVQ